MDLRKSIICRNFGGKLMCDERCFPRSLYKKIRRTLALTYLFTFIILILFRCTPPRLMPPSYGFSDVHPLPGLPGEPLPDNPLHGDPLRGREVLDRGVDNGKLTVAAMPSLHFGTSVLMGCAVGVRPFAALFQQEP